MSIKNFQNSFIKNTFGKSMDECFSEKICPICHEKITSFKDVLSLKEYRISGLCQSCQDKTFIEPTDEDIEYYELK